MAPLPSPLPIGRLPISYPGISHPPVSPLVPPRGGSNPYIPFGQEGGAPIGPVNRLGGPVPRPVDQGFGAPGVRDSIPFPRFGEVNPGLEPIHNLSGGGLPRVGEHFPGASGFGREHVHGDDPIARLREFLGRRHMDGFGLEPIAGSNPLQRLLEAAVARPVSGSRMIAE